MKRYFIIGTDTDCGKTYVTCQLLDYFKAANQRTMAIKPVISGVDVDDSNMHLQRYNGDVNQNISRWAFKRPISPHLAAEEEVQQICIQSLVDFCFDPGFAYVDNLLIESAGGLMAPLNYQETWIDVLLLSQIPVILVVGMRLGCLNHALLTELALRSHKIQCIGWIANCIDKDMLALPNNISTLIQKLQSPLLATIPYGGTLVSMPMFGNNISNSVT